MFRPAGKRATVPLIDRRGDPRRQLHEPATLEWFDENGTCHSERITIGDSSPNGLGIRLPQDFPAGQTVWIETDPSTIFKAVVRHSSPEGSGYFAGVVRVQHERRRVDRLPVTGTATLNWGILKGEKRSAAVAVRDVTQFGAQLESSEPVPVGVIAQLEGEQLECVGSTCYCRHTDDQYLVGLHMIRRAYDKDKPRYEGG